MTKDNMRKAALGVVPAELVLKNGRILNVLTREIHSGDVAVCGDTIVGVGSYHGVKEVDLEGRYLVPGLIDSHLHIESSMVTPAQFAGEVLAWGTTAFIADPHEMGNVKGLEAIRFFLEQAEQIPSSVYLMLPSCVPATPLEDSGAVLNADDLLILKDHPKVLGLGEMMNFVGVSAGDEEVYRKLDAFCDRMIDGHAPFVSGGDLNAYCLAGVKTDHECSCAEEVIEKIRAGMVINIREGSAAKNLETIIKAILENQLPCDRFCFCTDDKHVGEIRKEGHISYLIKKAVSLGLPVMDAYRMATIQPAQFYGLDKLGAIAPGKRADLVVVDNLEQVEIDSVYCGGKLVSRHHEPVRLPAATVPEQLFHTVNPGELTEQRLRLKADDRPAQVMEVIPNQLITKLRMEVLPQQDGFFAPDGVLNKIAVLERHHATGMTGVCPIAGFPIRGAAATTIGHDSHNLIIIGDNDRDMILAAQELTRCQGGYTLVQDGKVLATLPLPICGLITNAEMEEVEAQLEVLLETAHSMGISQDFEPFITMSFLSLPVIPEIKLTNRGIVLL